MYKDTRDIFVMLCILFSRPSVFKRTKDLCSTDASNNLIITYLQKFLGQITERYWSFYLDVWLSGLPTPTNTLSFATNSKFYRYKLKIENTMSQISG